MHLFFLVAFRLVADEFMGMGRQHSEVGNQKGRLVFLVLRIQGEGEKPDSVDLSKATQ